MSAHLTEAEQCDDCKGTVPSWHAPSEVWNLVVGGPEAKDDPGGCLCPNCFIKRAEAAGVMPAAWFIGPAAEASLAQMREALKLMHRRAQRAEGQRDAARFLLASWGSHPVMRHTSGYLASVIVKDATKALNRGEPAP